ncbi:MAG TPA: O-antigen ligase family protein [Flavobacterium sp.]
MGFFGFLIYDYQFTDLVKDVSHFLKPIVGVLVGFLVFYGNRDSAVFLKTIITVGAITATIHLFGIIFFSDFFKASISELRGGFGFDNFIEIFSFFTLLLSNRFVSTPIFKSRFFSWALSSILLLSIFLYFSRTMFVVFFLIGFSLLGYAKVTAKGLKMAGALLIIVLLGYAYIFSIKLDRNAKGVEGFLYKIKIAPEEIFKAKIDRENHEELWDHWRGYEASRAFVLIKNNPSSAVLGTGYGSLVNLKFRAPLGEDGMRYISTLHNGYMFVFYKTGVVGLLLLLLFLINLYLRIYRSADNPSHAYILKLISTIGLFYLFTTLIITGIFIPKDTIILILGGSLALERVNAAKNQLIDV